MIFAAAAVLALGLAAPQPGDSPTVAETAAAIARFERTLAMNPSDSSALRGLARAYAAVWDPRADAVFLRALAASPEDRKLRRDHAEYLWRQRRYEEGNAEMERLLAGAPAAVEAELRGRYGELLMEQSRFVQAAAELARACANRACSADRLELWANALLETGRFEESAAIWRMAIRKDPGDAQTHYGLGRLELLRGDSRSALAPLKEAVRLSPSSAFLHLDYGRALEASGQAREAESEYRTALRLDPDGAPAHYALGTLLARLGRDAEARSEIALFQAAFEASQRSRQSSGARRAQITLGWTRLRAGDPEAALAAFGGLTDDAEGWRGQGETLLAMGRRDDARRAFERAVELSPEDLRLQWALARAREGDSAP